LSSIAIAVQTSLNVPELNVSYGRPDSADRHGSPPGPRCRVRRPIAHGLKDAEISSSAAYSGIGPMDTQIRKPAREVELKLAVPDGAVGTLLAHPALQASAAQRAERRHEVTTYFDTPDHALARSGMSVRVRDSNGQRIQTLKADRRGGVAADRAEWEWPLAQDEPDIGLLEQTPVGDQLPQALDLEPRLVTDIDRMVRVLELDGGTVVEAVLDQGEIIAGAAREPVCELELELRAGDAAALYRFALELHAAVPLTVGSESKAARGHRLLSGTAPEAHKAGDIVLTPETSAAEAFRQILNAALGHLLVNQPAALSGDAEGVHQMRVAIRRLRAALTLFQPHLEAHATLRFQDELRRVGRIFGEARDWDVFCQQILPIALDDTDMAGWRDLLEQPARAKREGAHRRFVQELQAQSFTALVLGLAAWAEQRSLLGDAALDQPIGAVCPGLLHRLARKVDRRGRGIGRRSDAERHALRKSLKKLRYGIDFMEAVFPPKPVKSYLKHCKKLQQVLGDLNDAVTAPALADLLGDGTRPDLVPAIGALSAQLDRKRRDALHDLSKRWKAFHSAPRFWDEGPGPEDLVCRK
jgi:triphosphatase